MTKTRQKWLATFVPHRLEMLLSPAWQAAPRPLMRIIERLEIEHLRHGGMNNGHLFVSYEQFMQYGVSKKSIRSMLDVGEKLGLLKVIQEHDIIPGDRAGNIRPSNRYALTYVPERGQKVPSDEWKTVTKQRAEHAAEAERTPPVEAKPNLARRRA